MNKKEFETPDLYLASAIRVLLNKEPSFRLKDKRINFVYDASDELFEAINSYHAGVQANIYEYGQTLKRLRSEVLARRSSGGVQNE